MPSAKMPKLTEINIKNLRGLTDLTLEDARVFNLLVGPSEIGKTTVLEGIFIGSSFMFIQGVLMVNQFRGAVLDGLTSNRQAANALFRNITEKKIEIKAKIERDNLCYFCNNEFARLNGVDGKNIPINGEEYKQSGSQFLGVEGRATVTGDVDGMRVLDMKFTEKQAEIESKKHEIKLKGESEKITDSEEIAGYFPISEFSAFSRRNLLDATESAFLNKKEDEIVKVLQKVNPKVKSFNFIREQVYLDIGLQTRQPIYVAGNGLVEILSTLGELSAPELNILLLDEIGFGLYYASLKDYLRAILRFAKEQGKQVFATTHRKDMIVALAEVVAEEEDLREDVMCYSLSRDKHSITRAYGYNHRAIRHSVENDREIR